MPNEMTAAEAAERLETIDQLVLIKGIGPEYDAMRNAVNYAASLCRKIAAEEYKPVVRAKWIKEYVCNNCFHHNAEGMTPFCPYCGAQMDGKDDSHE